MEPLLIYDYLVLSRERVLEATRPVAEVAWAREFEIGLGTLGRSLTHIMISEWYYVQRLLERDVPEYEDWPIKDEAPPPFSVVVSVWEEQGVATRSAIAGVDDWSAGVTFVVTGDDGRARQVTTTRGGIVTQLALHEMHHRAQVLNMLRQLGVTLAEDLDFNAMMWERRVV